MCISAPFFKIIVFIWKNKCMKSNVIFNISICFMGVAILLIHIVNLVLKKRKREDEYTLMNFLIFTAFHFAVYLIFSFIKSVYTSNVFIVAFYTAFYIFNNLEVFLLFLYMLTYVEIKEKMRKVLFVINKKDIMLLQNTHSCHILIPSFTQITPLEKIGSCDSVLFFSSPTLLHVFFRCTH